MSNLLRFFQFNPIYNIITIIWFVLLGLCGIIAVLVVPISPEGSFLVTLGIGGLKVILGGVLLLFWLLSWYKLMELLLVYELQKNKEISLENIEF